jgi:hypothetical protein
MASMLSLVYKGELKSRGGLNQPAVGRPLVADCHHCQLWGLVVRRARVEKLDRSRGQGKTIMLWWVLLKKRSLGFFTDKMMAGFQLELDVLRSHEYFESLAAGYEWTTSRGAVLLFFGRFCGN